MKIGIVSLQFEESSTGGGGVHVGYITDQFLKLGHHVTVIAIHTNRTLSGAELIGEEAPYSVSERGKLKIIRFLLDKDIDHPYVGGKDVELDRIMRFAEIVTGWIKKNEKDFDIISLQGHHILPGYMAKELQSIKPKTVSYLHALETTYVTEKGDFVGAYEGTKEVLKRIREWEAMCRFADFVVVNSPIVRDEFKEIIEEVSGGAAEYAAKIKLIASGCEENFLMDDCSVDQKLKNVPEVVNLVTFCRIDPSKGVEYSIKGAKAAAKLCPHKFCLTIAGIPSSDEYIKELENELNDVPDNLEVKFLLMDAISPAGEKKKILDGEHIYILPTLKEPFGMSVIEASARGNMIVSAETNGPKYMFESDSEELTEWGVITEYGLLAGITEDHHANFADNVGKAIAWTVNNWPECSRHVLNFNNKVREKWTWEGIAKQYIELFKS